MLCWLLSIDVPCLKKIGLRFNAHPECEFQGEKPAESLMKLILHDGKNLRENSPIIRTDFRVAAQPDARRQMEPQRHGDEARPSDRRPLLLCAR